MSRNFLKGFFSSLTLHPRERRELPFTYCTDQEAFQKDLESVGADMYYAMGIVDESFEKNK